MGVTTGQRSGAVDGAEPYGGEDESAAVLRTVGKVIKMWRERAGLKQSELGAAIGYGEEQVSSVERGRRAPKVQFLEAADEVLGAGGMILGLGKDVEEARYPKKVRDLAKLEGEAVEMCAYANTVIHGLLQTEEYARALYGMRRPLFTEDEMDRQIAARLARQEIFEQQPAPIFSFARKR